MRKLILQMAITLDGVVAPENGKGVFDHNDEGGWTDTFRMLETVDTVLLGAGMHQEYLDYWQAALTNPKASQSEQRYATMAARTPHFVSLVPCAKSSGRTPQSLMAVLPELLI